MKPVVSIIIPQYNDPDMALATLESLYSTIDIDNFEVILVDDGSKDKIPKDYKRDNFRVFKHFTNLGVGAAFDTGVAVSRADNIILMGSDITFEENGWCRRMLNVLRKHQQALICTGCASTKTDNVFYGADIQMFLSHSDLTEKHPKHMDKNYRSVLQGKWRPRTGRGVYQIPSLMGAFYGVTKEWYNKISGFELHYKYGTLEPYISLKSWRLGGEVLVDSQNLVYHEFSRDPKRWSDYGALVYNQLLTAAVCFGPTGFVFAKHLEGMGGAAWETGSSIYRDKEQELIWLAKLVRENAALTPSELLDLVYELSYHKNAVTEKALSL